MTPRSAPVVIAAMTALTLAMCSRGQPAPAASADARRVVSVTPATTEAMFALGAGDRVVGRSRFCDWPPQAAKLPTVGGFVDVDLEAILQLRPDLVVGSSGPSSARLADKLDARGVATWFPLLDSFASIDSMLLGLGNRTGHGAEARRLVDQAAARAAAIERAVSTDPPPRVLMLLDVAPPVAVGPRSFADEMIRRARGINVLTDGGPWQNLGIERIIDLDPDVVVDASAEPGAASSGITPQAPGWRDVRAVRQGRIATMTDPRVLRPGPRVAEGLALLARVLHPAASLPMLASP
jgi:iron complex transport system substrate-binding protein